MFRLDTSLEVLVCRARPRNPLVAPPVAPLTRCCVLTAGPTERRIALYSDAIKMYTYRPPRILKLHCGVAGVWFACARAIRGVPNCPCMFRLRPGPPPPPWPQVNAVYRTDGTGPGSCGLRGALLTRYTTSSCSLPQSLLIIALGPCGRRPRTCPNYATCSGNTAKSGV